MIETSINQLSSSIEHYDRKIDALWDNKNIPSEEKGKLINSLSKKRVEKALQLSRYVNPFTGERIIAS